MRLTIKRTKENLENDDRVELLNIIEKLKTTLEALKDLYGINGINDKILQMYKNGYADITIDKELYEEENEIDLYNVDNKQWEFEHLEKTIKVLTNEIKQLIEL